MGNAKDSRGQPRQPAVCRYHVLRPGMRASRGHLFPTHFYYTLGIMQACSWQINTRPYEVAVPAELKNMRGTAINFSAQFVASYAFKSHDPLMYSRRKFPILSKEMLCHDS
ncbi:hypothetical protein PAMP_003253 [Pampus punctatissimus]